MRISSKQILEKKFIRESSTKLKEISFKKLLENYWRNIEKKKTPETIPEESLERTYKLLMKFLNEFNVGSWQIHGKYYYGIHGAQT